LVNSKEEYIKMSDVELFHWWYRSLHHLVLNVIKKYNNTSDVKILDAGCGTGGLLSFLRDKGYRNLSGFDISKDAVSFSKDKKLDIFQCDLRDYNEERIYDIIISNDTMYFFNINEQKAILNKFYKNLNGGGIVILNFPALNIFSGIHDKAVGIRQRFNKQMIEDMIDKDKFKIVEQVYWPFLLSPIILFIRFIQGTKLKLYNDVEIQSDINTPSNFINNILYNIVQFENRFFKKKPFGSSIFLVLIKIDYNTSKEKSIKK
jgi:SAM-dependent methyltransferase